MLTTSIVKLKNIRLVADEQICDQSIQCDVLCRIIKVVYFL